MNTKSQAFQLQIIWPRVAAFGFLLVLALLIPALGWPQPITGPLVNALLLITFETLGLWPAVALGSVTPLGGLLHGVLPLPLAVMMPFIVLGNATFVGVYSALRARVPGRYNPYIALGMAAVAKFALLYGTVTFFATRPFELALVRTAHAVTMPGAIVYNMSWPQLVTALAGGLLALAILRGLSIRSARSSGG